MSPPIMSSSFEVRENIHNTRHLQVLSNEKRGIFNSGLDVMLCSTPCWMA